MVAGNITSQPNKAGSGYTIVGVLVFQGKSAASFCHQVTAWFPDIFRNFYSLENHKIVKNSATATAREKISADMESLEF